MELAQVVARVNDLQECLFKTSSQFTFLWFEMHTVPPSALKQIRSVVSQGQTKSAQDEHSERKKTSVNRSDSQRQTGDIKMQT